MLLALALALPLVCARGEAGAICHRFAGSEETAQMLMSNRAYYEAMNQSDIDFRLQRLGGTPEELWTFAAAQALDFTEAERAAVDDAMRFLDERCAQLGYVLPEMDEIVFAKTTMAEECDAGAYTHAEWIFLGETLLSFGLSDDADERDYFRQVVVHELFHCLTRAHPQFRAAMYAVLGFTVEPEDYAFAPEIMASIISNPDVIHHDSHAAFLFDGTWRECAVVCYARSPFEKPGDSFFDDKATGLVPVDDLSMLLPAEDAENFWDVFGENTDYVIDPEETLADNFALTICLGPEGDDWRTPSIIEGIDGLLRAGW